MQMFDALRLNPRDPDNRDGIHGVPVWIAIACVFLFIELLKWTFRHPVASLVIGGLLVAAYCLGASA
jgi:hypothetical protein